MEAVVIKAKRISFSEEEQKTLFQAKQILDNFNKECDAFTSANEAANLLGSFLDEDIPNGYYIETY